MTATTGFLRTLTAGRVLLGVRELVRQCLPSPENAAYRFQIRLAAFQVRRICCVARSVAETMNQVALKDGNDLLGSSRFDTTKAKSFMNSLGWQPLWATPVSSCEDHSTIQDEVISRASGAVQRAVDARSSARTAANASSSRTHMIIVLEVKRTEQDTGAVTTSRLRLVDLAGFER